MQRAAHLLSKSKRILKTDAARHLQPDKPKSKSNYFSPKACQRGMRGYESYTEWVIMNGQLEFGQANSQNHLMALKGWGFKWVG